MTPSRRVVVLTGAVPFDDVPHAGGRYLGHLVQHLATRAEVTVVAASTPASRDAAARPGAPADLVLVGGGSARTLRHRALGRLVALGERWWRPVDPGMPPLALVADLVTGGPAARAVRTADVVDLQWSEQTRLVRLVRRLAPGARVVGTFHDVQSQLFSREPSRSAAGRLAWRWRATRARVHERRAARLLDAVIVFSDKDAHLLGSPSNARVVPPPLAAAEVLAHPPVAGTPTVLVVGHLARPENDDGVTWLLREVWPAVASGVPDARLRVVGAGASDVVQALAAAREDVDVVGFVADLDAEYAGAWCCVVPVRTGAGVKFKTVEALVHGTPVVSTPVGAEGVGERSWFAGLSTEPRALSEAVVSVLTDPAASLERAATVQALAAVVHGPGPFEAALDSAMFPGPGPAPLQ